MTVINRSAFCGDSVRRFAAILFGVLWQSCPAQSEVAKNPSRYMSSSERCSHFSTAIAASDKPAPLLEMACRRLSDDKRCREPITPRHYLVAQRPDDGLVFNCMFGHSKSWSLRATLYHKRQRQLQKPSLLSLLGVLEFGRLGGFLYFSPKLPVS